MSLGAIVVCRLDSRRLPAKALRKVLGRPLLGHVLDRCRQVRTLEGQIVVATSDRAVDDPIARFCRREGVRVFRGAPHDVAGRLLATAGKFGFDFFFRVNGDSPFVEPSLLENAASVMANGDYDFVTNLQPRSFPYGVSVELLRTSSYQAVYGRFTRPEHFEHATPFLYEHLDRFECFNIRREGEDLSRFRLTVDTPEDFAAFSQCMARAAKQRLPVGYEEAVKFSGLEEAA